MLYVRLPPLLEELHIAHGDGSFGRRLATIGRTDVLLIDDWGISPLNQSQRADLLEEMDDRVGSASSIITSQLPVKHWHEYLNDPTLADAILDRIVHNSHRIALQGPSMRDPETAKKKP